ncbi:MAG TPA: HRDC domain-containing protein [Spirochaetota bacterium]|nr:HRDC domain-containing protein [Spirochaetota bacterium]
MEDDRIVLVDSREGLAGLVRRLETVDEVAMDCEGESNLHRYGIHLCLVQIFDGERCYLVDPVVLGDISDMREFIESERVRKLMCSADFDMRLMHHTCGFRLGNVFDVQIAAKLLGSEHLSLQAILEEYLGVSLPKSASDRRSDWSKRPLSKRQMEYAAGDVLHLPPLGRVLDQRLAEKGLTDEAQKAHRALINISFRPKSDPHLRLPGANRLPAAARTRLKRLYQVRERIAERLDIPPFMVLANEVLVAAAKNPPSGKAAWHALKGMTRFARSRIAELEAALADTPAK